jgi:hypothetical protein
MSARRRPRFINSISEDLTVLDLILPESDADVLDQLAPLAAAHWQLGPGEWQMLRDLAHSRDVSLYALKLQLLTDALGALHADLLAPRFVRHGQEGRQWIKDRKGRRRAFSPAVVWGGMGPWRDDDRFELDPSLTAEKMDLFSMWLERQLIRGARAELRTAHALPFRDTDVVIDAPAEDPDWDPHANQRLTAHLEQLARMVSETQFDYLQRLIMASLTQTAAWRSKREFHAMGERLRWLVKTPRVPNGPPRWDSRVAAR